MQHNSLRRDLTMIEVVIDSIRVNLTNQQRIVILRQVDQERYLPSGLVHLRRRRLPSPCRD